MFKGISKNLDSEGPWPLNAIGDINRARKLLMDEKELISSDFYLAGPTLILDSLRRAIPTSDMTYYQFLMMNKVLEDIEFCEPQDSVVVVVYAVNRNLKRFPLIDVRGGSVIIHGIKTCEDGGS